MKSPREVLLRQHLSATPKLDKIRTGALSTVLPDAARATRDTQREDLLPVRAVRVVWRELIWPCRRVWAGMVVLWLAMWGIHWGLPDTRTVVASTRPAAAPAMFEALEEQRRSLAELIPPPGSPPVEPPRRSPKPRSDRRTEFFTM